MQSGSQGGLFDIVVVRFNRDSRAIMTTSRYAICNKQTSFDTLSYLSKCLGNTFKQRDVKSLIALACFKLLK